MLLSGLSNFKCEKSLLVANNFFSIKQHIALIHGINTAGLYLDVVILRVGFFDLDCIVQFQQMRMINVDQQVVITFYSMKSIRSNKMKREVSIH